MNSRQKSDKFMTPKSQVSIVSKRISHGVVTDSPFRNIPNLSTPPSRFARIINPFEAHLIERLHLPTFSPNVFVQNSTPKTEQKFRWSIEDISKLKPADIDETTVSQHVYTMEDPHVESIVQQKIDTFFSEKEIVPSPMNIKYDHVPLRKDCASIDENIQVTPLKAVATKETCDGATQTILTLPPTLPSELEEALKPYFTYHQEQQQCPDDMQDTSLYKKLFDFENVGCESIKSHDDIQSLLSSPPISTGISPILCSSGSRGLASPFDIPELKDCNLSPITKNSPKSNNSRLSKSACRLNFSEQMSVDASLIVPDLEQRPMSSRSYTEPENGFSPRRPSDTINFESTVNWSMEYKQISIDSADSTASSEKMDVSNSNTPHTKLFIGKGHRKRLSESFKHEDGNDNVFHCDDFSIRTRNKIFRNDVTDGGYHTQDTGDFSNNHCTSVFASTPTKGLSAK